MRARPPVDEALIESALAEDSPEHLERLEARRREHLVRYSHRALMNSIARTTLRYAVFNHVQALRFKEQTVRRQKVRR